MENIRRTQISLILHTELHQGLQHIRATALDLDRSDVLASADNRVCNEKVNLHAAFGVVRVVDRVEMKLASGRRLDLHHTLGGLKMANHHILVISGHPNRHVLAKRVRRHQSHLQHIALQSENLTRESRRDLFLAGQLGPVCFGHQTVDDLALDVLPS